MTITKHHLKQLVLNLNTALKGSTKELLRCALEARKVACEYHPTTGGVLRDVIVLRSLLASAIDGRDDEKLKDAIGASIPVIEFISDQLSIKKGYHV